MGDEAERAGAARQTNRFLGSLREALAAAGREDQDKEPKAIALPAPATPPGLPAPATANIGAGGEATVNAAEGGAVGATQRVSPSAAQAAREARGGTPNIPPGEKHFEPESPPTTRVVRKAAGAEDGDLPAARTQLVRGKQQIQRKAFAHDPVVGWLVIVGGPGLGAYRPIFEGNNTVGRSPNQRVPIDFGDEAISAEEQAYIRYDSSDRAFLFVPNLAKTNVVAINEKRPTAAVILQAMDVIMMGRTQLVFVPFCGPDFDWSEISDART